MKKITTIMMMLFALSINSQSIKGSVKDLEELTKKKLAVVILENDEEYVDKLKKKINNAKKDKRKIKLETKLKEYQIQRLVYNNLMKEVVPKYWKINNVSDVKYITEKELKKMAKSKSEDYAVLNLLPAEEFLTGPFDWLSPTTKVSINVITYGVPEKNRFKSTYKNYLINTNYNFPHKAKTDIQKQHVSNLETEKKTERKVLSKENLIVSLILSQNYINKVLELKDKINFSEFAGNQAKLNCGKLENKKVLMQSAIVNGKIVKDLKKIYSKGEVELVSAKRIAEAITSEEDVIVGFPLINRLVKAKGSLGPIGVIKITPVDHKVLMNTKTKEIVGFAKHSGITSFRDFREKDFQKINKLCK